jgi:hypothetical protein
MKKLVTGLLASLALSACSSSGGSSGLTDQDKLAQAELRNAVASAKTFFTDADTYDGFSPSEGSSIEPSLQWAGPGDPSPGTVAIVSAAGDTLLLVDRSASGGYFCATDQSGGTKLGGPADSYSAVDTPEECAAS